MALAISLHVLAATIWVGGMIFAYLALRPAAAALESIPLRFELWQRVLTRFSRVVWLCMAALLASGYWIVFAAQGGWQQMALHVQIMQGLGILMMMLFLHAYFAPLRRFRRAFAAQEWERGGAALRQVRWMMAVDILLGVAVIVVAAGGRHV